jgi:hypothetical protein
MAKGDVSNAFLVEKLDEGEVPADGITVLHADEGRELAFFLEPPGAFGVDGQADDRRVFLGHLMDGLDGLEGAVLGPGIALGSQRPLADEGGEELRVERALPHPWQVDLAAAAQARVVAVADLPVRPEQAEGRVAVGVDGQDPFVQLPGLLLDGRRGLGAGTRRDNGPQDDDENDSDPTLVHGCSLNPGRDFPVIKRRMAQAYIRRSL